MYLLYLFRVFELFKNGLDVPRAKSKFKENHTKDATEFDRVWNNWRTRWVEVKNLEFNWVFTDFLYLD